jgi:DNA polymerase
MAGEAGPELRAWVDYFRDLGVHDFYRRGEVVELPAVDAEAVPDSVGEAEALGLDVAAMSPVAANPFAPPAMKLISFNDLAPVPAVCVPAAERAAALEAIRAEIGDCTRCPLAYAGRRKIVFGDGSPTARLMFVGEGPGADEDAQGVPFVGKRGGLHCEHREVQAAGEPGARAGGGDYVFAVSGAAD